MHECDHRRTLTDLKKDFPFVDFSLVKDEDDALWTTRKENEPSEMAATLCYERADEFLRWLKPARTEYRRRRALGLPEAHVHGARGRPGAGDELQKRRVAHGGAL